MGLGPRNNTMQILSLRGAVGVDGSAEDTDFVGGGDQFEAAALQRAHFDHFVEEPVEQSDVDKFHFRSGDEKCSWAFHVDAGGGGRSEGAVTQVYKFLRSE